MWEKITDIFGNKKDVLVTREEKLKQKTQKELIKIILDLEAEVRSFDEGGQNG